MKIFSTLVISGINLEDKTNPYLIVDTQGFLPKKEKTPEEKISTLELAKKMLEEITGCDPIWACLVLSGVYEKEDGIYIIYSCFIPTEVKIDNAYNRCKILDLKNDLDIISASLSSRGYQ